jgi:hypothetical protein
MYSVLQQERTSLRNGQGMTVFRRLYLCDRGEDIPALPADDAPGSAAVVAEGGSFYLLDHGGVWQRADPAVGLGGCLWRS